MPDQPESLCPLCRSANLAARYRIRIPELGERTVAECVRCEYGCVVPTPTLEELERFYSKEYFEGEPGGRGFADYLGKPYVRKGEGWLAGRRLKREKPMGRVLEVGCGSAHFLRGVAETSGWEAFGTDLSAHIIEQAGREPGLQLFCGELAEAHFPPAHFEAVFLRNVLEHVPDPVALVGEVRRVLARGGLLWLLVPNGYTETAPFAAANRQGRETENLQGHLNFFPPVCLLTWLQRSGFQVEQIYTLGLKRGLFELGYLPRAWKVSQRRKPETTSSPVTAPLPAPPLVAPPPPEGWKHTLAYAHLRRFLKSSLKLPLWLPLGQELHAVVRLSAK
jgi:SAM-dependent methyltransferase